MTADTKAHKILLKSPRFEYKLPHTQQLCHTALSGHLTFGNPPRKHETQRGYKSNGSNLPATNFIQRICDVSSQLTKKTLRPHYKGRLTVYRNYPCFFGAQKYCVGKWTSF